MLFNSFEFLIFLPIVFCLYWFVFKRLSLQNLFVVFASYLFYGWWNWKFLVLIAFTSLCSYVSGILISNSLSSDNKKQAKIWCIANVVVNLLVLGVFKYYNFFVDNFVRAFSLLGVDLNITSLQLILPVGISFYTFQALSYTIDVYKEKLQATRNIVAFFAFLSFFPQLVAGPIERATSLLPQFYEKRTFKYENAVDGMRQILWGLFKKIVIADNCAEYVDKVFNDYSNYSGIVLFVAGIFFAFQIYGDFSGYSDIAIGTAKLFGIKIRDNFKTPYLSRDVSEFWKRWHISLNKWFVDYVYIPLGGSRGTKAIVARNVFVIFLLSGLWHGANWTYVAWGVYHAILFLPLILLNKNKRYTGVVAAQRKLPTLKEFGSILGTFVLIVFGWIIFRANSIQDAYNIFGKIFSTNFFSKLYLDMLTYQVPTIVSLIVCILVDWINRERRHGLDIEWIKYPAIRIAIYYIFLMAIVLYSGKNVTFIYFQF